MKDVIETTTFTANELEKMINDYVDYWEDPFGKGDNDITAANALPKSALPIAKQLLTILRNSEVKGERIAAVKKS
ncbi:hypothetical protein KOM00_00035 [Geomonas sp. Red69]|uniref:hypothetical protein n=1 Tax=Geomonas diazotrophica TaxID=2843197 RepID=UPI001C10F2F4|nr:hypothetical protein [Geomonas diazotrophica]MBU5635118.1 hypothetical protein [Geomonas diazotrophica]